jgi:putative PIN family toxin of toxin-antitoxin system
VSNPRPRVFLDSNVIFSGLYSRKGAPSRILQAFVTGSICVGISQQVLDEVVRTIKEKLPAILPMLKELLMSAPPEIQADPTREEVNRWEDRLEFADAAILAAAISSGVEYFITGDNHFLNDPDIAKGSCLRIVTPTQFVRQLESAEKEVQDTSCRGSGGVPPD